MDVAFFTDSYVPTPDGVAQVVHALARQLQRWGHRVRVFTMNPAHGRPTERIEVDGIPVVLVRSVPLPLYSQYGIGFVPWAAVRREGVGREVEAIHLHSPGTMGATAFLAARYYKKPLVGTFHTDVWAARDSFPGTVPVRALFRLATWFCAGTYLRCDVTTAPTPGGREALLATSRKPFRHPIEVVPNGIEVGRFHPGVSRPDWRFRCGLPDGPLVSYLGRLTLDKGVHRFLSAVSEIPRDEPFSAIVGGAGPEEDAVRERVSKEGGLVGRVRYVGSVAEEEKSALLSQSDLFVVPSTSDTSSVSLLEAMACGTPCVVSDVGGPRDLVVSGASARMVSVETPGALSGAISELLRDPGARARLSAEGVEYVRRRASIEVTAGRFLSIYHRLVDERNHGSRLSTS